MKNLIKQFILVLFAITSITLAQDAQSIVAKADERPNS